MLSSSQVTWSLMTSATDRGSVMVGSDRGSVLRGRIAAERPNDWDGLVPSPFFPRSEPGSSTEASPQTARGPRISEVHLGGLRRSLVKYWSTASGPFGQRARRACLAHGSVRRSQGGGDARDAHFETASIPAE